MLLEWLSIGLGLVFAFVLVVLPALRPRQDAEREGGTFVITSHPDCAVCQHRAALRGREGETLGVIALLVLVAFVVIGLGGAVR